MSLSPSLVSSLCVYLFPSLTKVESIIVLFYVSFPLPYFLSGVYKVPYFFKSVGKEYQDGKGISWMWRKGKQYHLSTMILGRTASGEKGKGTEISGKKIMI